MTVDLSVPELAGTREGRPLVIGITGPIAAGKSTVAELLRERGATIVDADRVYRSLLTPGSTLWGQILERFGSDILDPDNRINRAALGNIVFRDSAALADLERITHPAVVAELRRQIAESRARVVAIEAVKLTQAGLLPDVDSLWFVTADPEIRLARVLARNGLDEEQARARIAASLDLRAPDVPIDVTIENSGELSATAQAVDEAWRTLARKSARVDSGTAGTTDTFEEDA